jgi:quinol monooxygenase YgiN
MITVLATMHFRPEALNQALPILERLVETTRQESGCRRYDLYRHTAAEGDFTLIEEWTDQASLDAHGSRPTFQSSLAALGPLASGPSHLVKLESVFVSHEELL